MTLWQLKIIRSIIHKKLIKNAGMAGTIFARRGPAANITNIPAIEISP